MYYFFKKHSTIKKHKIIYEYFYPNIQTFCGLNYPGFEGTWIPAAIYMH